MTTTMNTGAASLLPCPMCGAAPKLIVGYSPLNHAFVDCDRGMQTALKDTGEEVTAMWNRRSPTPQADAAPSLPRYTEWLHLRTHGQWSDGVPEWARDHDGRMNDVTAANAVIEELADAAIAAGGAQEPIYQQQYCGEGVWRDMPKDKWDEKQAGILASDQRFRIVYAAQLPREAATVALTDEQREAIMEQAQVFASAWSLVGGPFDYGDALETAEQEKENLRALLAAAANGEQ